MKKIYICAESGFPRTGASSNYIEYLSLACSMCGYEVIVLGLGICDEQKYKKTNMGFKYKEIYFNLYEKSLGKNVVNYLKKNGANSDDIIIFYMKKSHNLLPIIHYAKKNRISTIACVVEWHQRNQFNKGLKGLLNFIDYYIGFYYLIPKCKNIFPISSYLEEYFNEKKCNCLRLPILSNPFEFDYKINKPSSKIRFIYSGNGMNKDRVDSIIKSFSLLKKEELKKVELHLTGMNKESLKLILKDDSKILEKNKENIIVHPWMEYNDLVNLLKKMDFVFILRDNNRVTKANFPSKIPEMMSYGIVPIISNVGDYPKFYIKDNINGILVDGSEAIQGVEIVRNILKLDFAKILEMKKAARLTTETVFYYECWVKQIKNFFEKL